MKAWLAFSSCRDRPGIETPPTSACLAAASSLNPAGTVPGVAWDAYNPIKHSYLNLNLTVSPVKSR